MSEELQRTAAESTNLHRSSSNIEDLLKENGQTGPSKKPVEGLLVSNHPVTAHHLCLMNMAAQFDQFLFSHTPGQNFEVKFNPAPGASTTAARTSARKSRNKTSGLCGEPLTIPPPHALDSVQFVRFLFFN
ncbi:hypothetical protein M378DRAFT_182223 [Amanita muscaria Koide BX008]|uniref:Uncharacterized protein n=1 Tax=Amanita muscaria (strain Koide BX008) TaxID=946122 RepID=A0A0C2WFY6_AMAMK|nr:hypothetical protein M378DRAFT_182223 [Amanita muscaria Koide BX008]